MQLRVGNFFLPVTHYPQDWGCTPEDEIVGQHHRLNGREFEQILGDSEGQGSLVCHSPWVAKSQTWLSDWTAIAPVEASWEEWDLEYFHLVEWGFHPRSRRPEAFALPSAQSISQGKNSKMTPEVRWEVSPEHKEDIWAYTLLQDGLGSLCFQEFHIGTNCLHVVWSVPSLKKET